MGFSVLLKILVKASLHPSRLSPQTNFGSERRPINFGSHTYIIPLIYAALPGSATAADHGVIASVMP